MTLIRTSLLSAISVIIKMITMLGINKVLAVYVGPSGYAIIGQFQNVIQIITTFASGAINTGVIKYTAEYYEEPQKQQQVWQTAGSIVLIGSLFSSFLIIIFNQYIAQWLFKDTSLASVLIWFAVTLTLFTFNALLLAILNGKKNIGRYVLANICGSIFSLIVTIWLSLQFGLYGALLALAIYQSLSFFVTLTLCIKTSWFKCSYLIGKIDKNIAKNLLGYTAMAITSALCIPVSQMIIRNHLGETLGWNQAGYWEAMCRLSAAYLMLVTTTLSVYYLPRLSELKEATLIKKEIIQGYKIILPFTILCGLIIYLLRDFIITILFTTDFSPMRQLFAWQMVGDSLKIASWILAFLMLSKAMTKLFIITEIIFSLSFITLNILFIPFFGLEGTVIAYAVNYLCYFVLMVHIFLYKGYIYR